MERNINDDVWVKLTAAGVEAHKAHDASHGLSTPTTETTRGWTRFVMWEFMHVFGPHCYNGGPQMFYGNIVRFAPPEE